jgi:hypothetical protein
MTAILTGVRWNLDNALLCISFMPRDGEHFFMYLLANWTSSLRIGCSTHVPFKYKSYFYWRICLGLGFPKSRPQAGSWVPAVNWKVILGSSSRGLPMGAKGRGGATCKPCVNKSVDVRAPGTKLWGRPMKQRCEHCLRDVKLLQGSLRIYLLFLILC